MRSNRRTFLKSAGLAAASASFVASSAAADELPLAPSDWDLSWLQTLKGKHKQVFDLGGRQLEFARSPLRVVRNYLNAHRDVFNLAYPDINTIVGITSEAFPLNASDDLWKTFAIGERWKIVDPWTNAPATRNIFYDIPAGSDGANASVKTLLGRGTMFWQCNNALNAVVDNLAAATSRPAADVRKEVVAGLLPHVKLVPAHTMLLGLVQQRGCSYEKL